MKLPTLEGINAAIVDYVMESVEFSQDGYIDSRHLVEDELVTADDEYIVDMLEAHRRYADVHQRRANDEFKGDNLQPHRKKG